MRHRSLLFRNRRVSLLPLRGLGLWSLLLGGRPAGLALRRLLRRGNRHLLRGRPTGGRTWRTPLRRRNARGQQRRHASDEKPVSPHFALLLSMESESRATSRVQTALRPFPRSTFWTNNGTSAFHSMLSAPRISRARNTLIEPMPRGCYLPRCRRPAARSISSQEIIVGARWLAPRRKLQRSERVLNWDFRKCCREPQAHEIWSRCLSRVELRPRRLPRYRKCPEAARRIHLAPIGRPRKLRRRHSARRIFLRRLSSHGGHRPLFPRDEERGKICALERAGPRHLQRLSNPARSG